MTAKKIKILHMGIQVKQLTHDISKRTTLAMLKETEAFYFWIPGQTVSDFWL